MKSNEVLVLVHPDKSQNLIVTKVLKGAFENDSELIIP